MGKGVGHTGRKQRGRPRSGGDRAGIVADSAVSRMSPEGSSPPPSLHRLPLTLCAWGCCSLIPTCGSPSSAPELGAPTRRNIHTHFHTREGREERGEGEREGEGEGGYMLEGFLVRVVSCMRVALSNRGRAVVNLNHIALTFAVFSELNTLTGSLLLSPSPSPSLVSVLLRLLGRRSHRR